MNRVVKSIIVLATLALAVPMFAASQATSSVTVSASVAAVCTISTTTNLAFGAYDPVVANASTAKDETAPATVSVSCTKNTAGVVLDFASSSGTMANGGTNLNFNLFQDSAHGTPFGSGVAGVAMTFGSKAAQAVDIYGQIPANQDVPAGAYSGTVTARVNY